MTFLSENLGMLTQDPKQCSFSTLENKMTKLRVYFNTFLVYKSFSLFVGLVYSEECQLFLLLAKNREK